MNQNLNSLTLDDPYDSVQMPLWRCIAEEILEVSVAQRNRAHVILWGLECGKDVSGVAFAGLPVAGRPAMGDAGTWPPQDLMVVCDLSLGWKADRRWFLNVAQL